MGNFQTIPFQDQLRRLGYLLKNTLTVLGQDLDIVNPWVRMILYGFLGVSLFFLGVLLCASGFSWFAGIGMILVSILLFFYQYPYFNYQEIRQSWLVYQTTIGNDRSYADAVQTSRELSGMVWKLAGLDLLMGFIGTLHSSNSKQGIVGALINLVIEGLEEVWDLVNHFLLPAACIDRMGVQEGVTSLKSLRDRVPETLAGVFGIDFAGTVVRSLMIPLYLLLILLSLLLGYGIADWYPATTIDFERLFSTEVFESVRLRFNWVPLLLAVYLGQLFKVLLERTVTSTKVIYFTVFYTLITHPERIPEERRSDFEKYLKMDPVNDGSDSETDTEST